MTAAGTTTAGTTATGAAGAAGRPAGQRSEVLRALGALLTGPASESASVARTLGLPAFDPTEHTDAFMLSLPPHAAIHLGPDGALGGEGADRVAGFWRALGLTPPEDADHLGVLLLLYAELRDARDAAAAPATRRRLTVAAATLLHEHLWSWAPAYLAAIGGIDAPTVAPWADLALAALEREVADSPTPPALPLALRSAPPPLTPDASRDLALDTVIAPLRSGLIITRHDLARAAERIGVGARLGERRYTLRAMLAQDAAATLRWLAGHADDWAAVHAATAPIGTDPGGGEPGADPTPWWQSRARHTAHSLRAMAIRAGEAPAR